MVKNFEVGDVHVGPLMLEFSQATYLLIVLHFFGTVNLNLLQLICHVIDFVLKCLAALALQLELLGQVVQLEFELGGDDRVDG